LNDIAAASALIDVAAGGALIDVMPRAMGTFQWDVRAGMSLPASFRLSLPRRNVGEFKLPPRAKMSTNSSCRSWTR
jgi:hypothetical protein